MSERPDSYMPFYIGDNKVPDTCHFKPGRNWTTMDACYWYLLPHKPGVYAIYVGGELVYIGQSMDLRARFKGHNIRYGHLQNCHTPWGTFPDDPGIILKFRLSQRQGDWLMWEFRLIRRLTPRFNKRLASRWAA